MELLKRFSNLARYRTVLICPPLVAFILLTLSVHPSVAQSRDVGGCSEYDGKHLQKCMDGSTVWAWFLTLPDTNGGRPILISGYTSQAAAQRSLESQKELCETVSRWEHRECNRSYGAPFCVACIRNPASMLLTEADKNLLAAARSQIDQWYDWAKDAVHQLRQGEPENNPYKGVGGVMRDYADNLKATIQRVNALQVIMDRLTTKSAYASELRSALDSASRSFSETKGRYASLPQVPIGTAAADQQKITEVDKMLNGKWRNNSQFGYFCPTPRKGKIGGISLSRRRKQSTMGRGAPLENAGF